MATPAGLEYSVSPPGSIEDASIEVFSSTSYRADTTSGVAWSSALVPALAGWLLPVVVLTTVAVLQGLPVLSHLAWAIPAAIGGAWLWAQYRLRSEIARIYLSGGSAAVLTTWDLLSRRGALYWQPVLDLRVSHKVASVALGDTLHQLYRSDWPDFERLTARLRAAREHVRHAPLPDPVP